MARRRKVLNLVIGAAVGLVFSVFFREAPPRVEEDCALKPEPVKVESGLLLVGVMTAAKYVDSRARAVYETWGGQVPGRVLLFSSEFSRSRDVPLVPLAGVDDSYPPQRKSFAMLKYMHDNFLDQFEWFMRADDDVYVRTDRLEELLRSVDSRKPWFIGQTGRGNSEELGLLSLEDDENFCMGGPGVILSRETLRRVAPHVDLCLQNLFTTHEDVELGRCVRKFAGVACTWSYEMQVILYHNQSGEAAFSGDLNQKEVHRAITMHPVKQPHHMHRLHNYVKGLIIRDKQQESINLHRDIASSMEQVGVKINQLAHAELVEDLPLFPEPPGSEHYLGDPELLGTPTKLTRFQSRRLEDVLDWELISKSLYSYKDLNPRRRIGSSLKAGLGDIVREVMEAINSYSKQRGRIIDFKEILYGYWRVDPLHGADVILDMSLTYKKYRGHKMTVPVRRHAYVQQTFTGMEIREASPRPEEADPKQAGLQQGTFINDVLARLEENLPLPFNPKPSDKACVNFILPLRGRHATFVKFMGNYETVCVKEQERTRLMIVLYKDEDFDRNVELITRVQEKHPGSEISYKVIEEAFSRGRALQHGISGFEGDDLLFFIDVDIIFDHKSLTRVRQNTVKRSTVYFPIVYSLYSPRFGNGTRRQSGFWRQFGFGIASIYKSDFESLGGFNTTISGWGLEDVDLFDNMVKSPMKIIRSVDPGLVHMYHPVKCDNSLVQAQKDMCIGTKANVLGSVRDLQDFYMKYKDLFR